MANAFFVSLFLFFSLSLSFSLFLKTLIKFNVEKTPKISIQMLDFYLYSILVKKKKNNKRRKVF